MLLKITLILNLSLKKLLAVIYFQVVPVDWSGNLVCGLGTLSVHIQVVLFCKILNLRQSPQIQLRTWIPNKLKLERHWRKSQTPKILL